MIKKDNWARCAKVIEGSEVSKKTRPTAWRSMRLFVTKKREKCEKYKKWQH